MQTGSPDASHPNSTLHNPHQQNLGHTTGTMDHYRPLQTTMDHYTIYGVAQGLLIGSMITRKDPKAHPTLHGSNGTRAYLENTMH